MGWARFDDCYTDHPKIVAAGALAELLDMRAIIYCARYETDGRIPRDALARLSVGIAQPRTRAAKLVEVGRWRETADGWEIVDYLDYNPPAAEVIERRRVRSEAGRRGGIRSGETRRSKHEANASALASRLLEANTKQTRTPSPSPIVNSSPNSLTRDPPTAPDDDEIESKARRAIDQVVTTRMQGRSIRNPTEYRNTARRTLELEVGLALRRIIATHPGAPDEMLAAVAAGEPTPYLAQYRIEEAHA